jgi:hypothetical protein
VPDTLIEWRMRKLKESGCNAYRCAHNPPTPELLDVCDREGILVLDENRYYRSAPQALEELESMVRRDRNHPSIVFWSICNEEFAQATEIGGRIAAAQVARVKQLDPTRPVTGAMLNTGYGPGLEDKCDVVSVNYNVPIWDSLHERHPQKALVITETTAAVTTRGCYEENAAAGYCDAYDRVFCPCGNTVRENELAILKRPFVAGGFVWTGFDYRGEPGPYTWPSVGVHLGFLDTCGFPKDSFYLYQAFWTKPPMVHLSAALELARPRRRADPRGGLQQLRDGEAIPQRQKPGRKSRAGRSRRRVVGPLPARHAAGGGAGRQSRRRKDRTDHGGSARGHPSEGRAGPVARQRGGCVGRHGENRRCQKAVCPNGECPGQIRHPRAGTNHRCGQWGSQQP